MATKKNEAGNEIFTVLACAAITVIFSLYHFAKLKAKYMTGDHTRRVYDMRMSWEAMVASGALAIGYIVLAVLTYEKQPWTAFVSIPLGLFVFNWVGKIQAQAFLGVVVDYQQDLVFFPPNPESLDVGDYLMVLPAIRQFTSMDSVPLGDIQRITRQAGKSLFMHGDFGSRRITFTNKLKRDECIHLVTANGARKVKMESEHE